MGSTVVIVSVDTEEDNWRSVRTGVSVENIRELPRLQAHCDRLGVPVSYFTTYQVVSTPWAAEILRGLAQTGRAEVAAHVHPWNTPPLDEPLTPQNTMMKNLPQAVQRAKLATLTRSIEEAVGVRPTSFRAGRFGLGRETTQVLIEQGYRVDSSVTPWISWAETDGGADFTGAPLSAYTLDGTTDPREPAPGGPLLEIPLTCGYSRWPFSVWHEVYTTLWRLWPRRLGPAGLASRLGVVHPIILSPEVSTPGDMLRLTRHLVAHDVPNISAYFHSSSLRPGLTPWMRTNADVERLYRVLSEFVDGLGRFTTPIFTTLSGAARLLATPP